MPSLSSRPLRTASRHVFRHGRRPARNPCGNTAAYSNDPVGCVTTKTETLAATSNRLTAVGAQAQTYDAAGRRTATTFNGATWTYAYNALGQRLKKASGSDVRLFAYHEQGHLLGEYDGTGKLIQETVWLGDTPVATLRLPAGASAGPAEVFYVHADHLDTPRRIVRPTDNKIVWQWESEAFGNSLPNENPWGLGVFAYHLRFPGQYFDTETELHYNYFRDYDPTTGRYVQSDPIGLAGGINSYTYVNGNPVSYTDPDGLRSYAPYTPMRPQYQYTPQPAPTYRPPSPSSPYQGDRAQGLENWGELLGNLTGAGQRIRHPSIQTGADGLRGPEFPRGPGCILVCPPKSATQCSSGDECRVHCGQSVGPSR